MHARHFTEILYFMHIAHFSHNIHFAYFTNTLFVFNQILPPSTKYLNTKYLLPNTNYIHLNTRYTLPNTNKHFPNTKYLLLITIAVISSHTIHLSSWRVWNIWSSVCSLISGPFISRTGWEFISSHFHSTICILIGANLDFAPGRGFFAFNTQMRNLCMCSGSVYHPKITSENSLKTPITNTRENVEKTSALEGN